MQSKRKKAVSLQYRHGKNSLPKITAKGKGKNAERIIEIAKEYGIPVKEDPDLVEVLSGLEIQEEIPSEIYVVVAELLAFVYNLNQNENIS
ncbi:flagellar biosynthesis protein [Candidatus Magnetomoraceae bacterium gMMP-15]